MSTPKRRIGTRKNKKQKNEDREPQYGVSRDRVRLHLSQVVSVLSFAGGAEPLPYGLNTGEARGSPILMKNSKIKKEAVRW